MLSKVLIFGGTGSLGTMIIRTWVCKVKEFIVYSRDEYKQWVLKNAFPQIKITFILGDVTDKQSVISSIRNHDPSLVIVASAMKHVERCEENVRKCIDTNSLGLLNIIEAIEELSSQINLQKLVMVSTDKACAPVNVYGMSKSICEHIIQNTPVTPNSKGKNIDLVCVRYGNVLNSNGSIIPLLFKQAHDPDVTSFTLTDKNMTRFYMTLEESVNLIEDTVYHGKAGEIWIPKLDSMKILDLMNIFSKRYNKPVKIIGIRPGEKIHESLISQTESLRTYMRNGRYVISPKITEIITPFEYTSADNILSETTLTEKLHDYLEIEQKVSLIVLGSTGMLGSHIVRYFRDFPNYQVIALDRKMLNITTDTLPSLQNTLENLGKRFPLVVLVNCIGKTNKVNASEKEFDLINVQLPHALNHICSKNNWKFIQPSTDCVFSGSRPSGQGYSETDQSDATDLYGHSKYLGECGMVIRLSIIGKETAVVKRGLYEKVLSSPGMNGYTNHHWNGVTCLEYAKILQQIIQNNLWWIGVRHIVPDYIVTKEQLISSIKNVNKLNICITPTVEHLNNRVLTTIYNTKIYINNLDTQLIQLKDFQLH
jgi:UDP-N-acetylglucosamine 4,6-dehydratase/5-epimerase